MRIADLEEFLHQRGVPAHDVPFPVRWKLSQFELPGQLDDAVASLTLEECPQSLRDQLTDARGKEQRAFDARLASRDWIPPGALAVLAQLEALRLVQFPLLSKDQVIGLRPFPDCEFTRATTFLATEAEEDGPGDLAVWLRKIGWPRWCAWRTHWQPTSALEFETIRRLTALVMITGQLEWHLTAHPFPEPWGVSGPSVELSHAQP